MPVASLQNENGVDPYSQAMQPILADLQANILKAHGRDEVYHLFLKFTHPQKTKTWIQAYAQDSHQVTSAAKQFEDGTARKTNPNYSGGMLGCFFLSAAGYRALGFSIDRFESSFKGGMKNREDYTLDGYDPLFRIDNKDPQPSAWQSEYQTEIHAMLLLGQDCREIRPCLEDKVAEIISSLRGIAEVFVERGNRLVTNEGHDLEHFGYRDGISNPLFFIDDITERPRDRFDQAAPLSLVLVKDPFGRQTNSYGSYVVFRKLSQDVSAFNRQVGQLTQQVNRGNGRLTGAQIIGRFKDGTPVTDHNSPAGANAVGNNFNYQQDDGRRCPVQAHIRLTNPRDGRERDRRIVRRGIPYGKPGAAEVGLLFMCYQSSIHAQFEFIQRIWVDNPAAFPPRQANRPQGDDPLIGQAEAEQHWLKEYDNPVSGQQSFNFGDHVTLLGGEYFFAPSLSFLKNIETSQESEEEQEETVPDYLIIAKYRLEHYDYNAINMEEMTYLKDIVHRARPLAEKWFGRKKSYDMNLPEDVEPTVDLEFKHTASFYTRAFDEEFPEADEKGYGWMAIVSEEGYHLLRRELQARTEAAVMFRLLFDIEIFPLNQDASSKDVYENMTPSHWH